MTLVAPAGFWRRFAALIYDSLILIALWMVATALAMLLLALAVPGLQTAEPDVLHSQPLFLFWLGLWWAGYYGWSWRKGGQTVGMKAWRLQLVSALNGGLQNWQIGVRLGVSLFVCALLLALYSALNRLGVSHAGWFCSLFILALQLPALAIQERFSQTLIQVLAKATPVSR